MKFVLALIVGFVFAALLATGVVLGVQQHSWWLLLICLSVFVVLFARIGCRNH